MQRLPETATARHLATLALADAGALAGDIAAALRPQTRTIY
ncbi:hypothetical protein [Jeongeupia sp. USM3]|nr:hypothetical protein [Jeongeupia sp. USM3]